MKMVRVIRRGARNGITTERKVRQAEAPSTLAASYSSWGTFCRPARRIIDAQGAFFQTSSRVTATRAMAGLAHQTGRDGTKRVMMSSIMPYWLVKEHCGGVGDTHGGVGPGERVRGATPGGGRGG